jgi:hypothetical protein
MISTHRMLVSLARKLAKIPTLFDAVAVLDDLPSAAKSYAGEAERHGEPGRVEPLARGAARPRLRARRGDGRTERGRASLVWLVDAWPGRQGARHRGLAEAVEADERELARGSPDLPRRPALARPDRRSGEGAQQASRRYHDKGDLWAATALALRASKKKREALRAAHEAARREVRDPYRELLLTRVVTRAQWKTWRRSLPDLNHYREEWLAAPGAELEPDAPSPHCFGGKLWKTSACRGCGHPIRAWFTLDLAAIPEVRLPGWRFFPILGCADCMVWMGRHDYRIDSQKRRAALKNVAIDCERFGGAYEREPRLPRASARLAWRKPIRHPRKKDFDEQWPAFPKAQVGGAPAWVQGPQTVWCPACGQRMRYVAAMACIENFEPNVTTDNGSGQHYHFACAPCGMLSVIAQWT